MKKRTRTVSPFQYKRQQVSDLQSKNTALAKHVLELRRSLRAANALTLQSIKQLRFEPGDLVVVSMLDSAGPWSTDLINRLRQHIDNYFKPRLPKGVSVAVIDPTHITVQKAIVLKGKRRTRQAEQ